MNWSMDDIKAEVDYRRYGTTPTAARKHLEHLRGTTTRLRRSRPRGARTVD